MAAKSPLTVAMALRALNRRSASKMGYLAAWRYWRQYDSKRLTWREMRKMRQRFRQWGLLAQWEAAERSFLLRGARHRHESDWESAAYLEYRDYDGAPPFYPYGRWS